MTFLRFGKNWQSKGEFLNAIQLPKNSQYKELWENSDEYKQGTTAANAVVVGDEEAESEEERVAEREEERVVESEVNHQQDVVHENRIEPAEPEDERIEPVPRRSRAITELDSDFAPGFIEPRRSTRESNSPTNMVPGRLRGRAPGRPVKEQEKEDGLQRDTVLRDYYVKPPYGNLSKLEGAGVTKMTIESTYLLPIKMAEYYKGFEYASKIKLLLYGPPGCGKTFCVKALAGAISEEAGDEPQQVFNYEEDEFPLMRIFDINASTIKGGTHGDDDKNISRIWDFISTSVDEEREKNRDGRRMGWNRTGAIIFLDEFEAVGLSRKLVHGENHSITSLLTVLDGVREYKSIRVVAATNIPWNLDSALLSRFPAQVFIDLPTDKTRMAVVRAFLKKLGEILEGANDKTTQTRMSAFVNRVCDVTGVATNADFILETALKKYGYMDVKGKSVHRDNGRRGRTDARSPYGYSLRDLDNYLTRFHTNLVAIWEYLLSTKTNPPGHDVTFNETIEHAFSRTIELFKTVTIKKAGENRATVFAENKLTVDFVYLVYSSLLEETAATQTSSINLDEYASLIYYKLTGIVPPEEKKPKD